MTGDLFAIGPCAVCGRPFAFDVETVPSVVIDPITRRPPASGDAEGIARSARQPLCYRCAREIVRLRAERGLPDLWQGRWGQPLSGEEA